MAEQDIITKMGGSKMYQIKSELADLRKLLEATDDPDKIATLKKEIMEKETYYNILAERARMNS